MKTFAFTTDSSAPDEAIVTHSACRKVIIYENNQAGTGDYLVRAPLSSDAQITRPAGSKTEFICDAMRPFWPPGETVGYVSAASGSLNMVQEETA